jgi:hypothetical protein
VNINSGSAFLCDITDGGSTPTNDRSNHLTGYKYTQWEVDTSASLPTLASLSIQTVIFNALHSPV